MTLDRRTVRRAPLWQTRRRYPRIHLDVDWMLDSELTSTWGRGLDLSLRSARLSLARRVEGPVVLYVGLPGRARMFRARGHIAQRRSGLVIRFDEVDEADLALLAECLIATAGLKAVPQLGQKFHRFTELHRRFLATST